MIGTHRPGAGRVEWVGWGAGVDAGGGVVRDGCGAAVVAGACGARDAVVVVGVGAGAWVFGASGIVVGAAASGRGSAVADPAGAGEVPGVAVAETPPIAVVDEGLGCGTEPTVAAAFVARSVPGPV
jgi:hypothetical protein